MLEGMKEKINMVSMVWPPPGSTADSLLQRLSRWPKSSQRQILQVVETCERSPREKLKAAGPRLC